MQRDRVVSYLVKTCNIIFAHFWFAWLVGYADVKHSSRQGVLATIYGMIILETIQYLVASYLLSFCVIHIYIFNDMRTKAIRDFTVYFRIRDTFNPKGIIVKRSNTSQRSSCILGSKIIVKSPDLFQIHSNSS